MKRSLLINITRVPLLYEIHTNNTNNVVKAFIYYSTILQLSYQMHLKKNN